MCEFQNRTLFLHLPAEFIQRLDTRPLAGHLAAFEQVQRRGLADVADAEKLLLVHHLGNAVPVNGEYIHL